MQPQYRAKKEKKKERKKERKRKRKPLLTIQCRCPREQLEKLTIHPPELSFISKASTQSRVFLMKLTTALQMSHLHYFSPEFLRTLVIEYKMLRDF